MGTYVPAQNNQPRIEDMRTLITMLFGGQDDGFCVISKSVQYLAIKLGHLMMGPLTHVTKDTKK